MAQPAMNAKIEELRFRLKTDPKSRLFYPLAEELRKAGQHTEAEQVLRTGLVVHGSYLSAWVSLGRVLRDQKKDADAVEALTKALQLDPGNVVAARLLADAYLALGDKVEAIKKYKLVHALLPADQELEATIATLERELRPPEPEPEPPPPPPPVQEESPFDRTMPPFAETEQATGDAEPMHLAHEESPFEEPVTEYTAAALEIEAPAGFHVDTAPLAAEVPAPLDWNAAVPAAEPAPSRRRDGSESAGEDAGAPVERADVFAPEGLPDVATGFSPSYDQEQDGLKPEEADVFAPASPASAKISRLEGWLSKVARKEVGGV